MFSDPSSRPSRLAGPDRRRHPQRLDLMAVAAGFIGYAVLLLATNGVRSG